MSSYQRNRDYERERTARITEDRYREYRRESENRYQKEHQERMKYYNKQEQKQKESEKQELNYKQNIKLSENTKFIEDQMISNKISRKIFDDVCEQVETNELVRVKMYNLIVENKIIELLYSVDGFNEIINSFNGTINGIVDIERPLCLDLNGCDHIYTNIEIAKSFNIENIEPYKIKHPNCIGWEIIVEYSTNPFAFWKRSFTIFCQKSI